MSLTRSVAHNMFYQIVGRVVSALLTLVIFILVARYLGVEGYGFYTTATAFLQFFGIVVDLGLYIYLAKALGEPGVDEASIVGNVFTLRLVSAVVILGFAPLAVLAFPYPATVKLAVAVMSLFTLFVTLSQVLAGVFQKTLHTGKFILAEVVGRVVQLIGTVIAIRLGVGLIGIIWVIVLSSAVSFVATFVWARGYIRFRLRFDFPLWKQILSATWPIALSIMFNVVYFKIDTIILSLYYSARDVGIYGAPYKIFEAFISIPAIFAGLLTPILTTAYLTDRARFTRILQRGFEVLLLMALPLVVGTQFVARDVMKLIAPGFVESGAILQVLVFGSAAIFIGYLFTNAIVVVNRQRTMVWAYASVAVSSVILYLLTIPRFSYFGAATITVIVETAIAAIAAWVVLRTSGTRLSLGPSARIVVAAIGMALVMTVARNLPWYVNGTIGVFVYAAIVLAMNVIDRSMIREIVRRTEP